MELDEFITTSLLSIKKGIRNANLNISEGEGKTLGIDDTIQYHIDHTSKGVKFDVAVTVSNEKETEGGGKIRVAVIDIGGGKTLTSKEEHISRISFEVGAFKSVH